MNLDYQDLLKATPVGIFFFKNELKDLTTEIGLRRIVKEINNIVSEYEDKITNKINHVVSPSFIFTEENNLITISIYDFMKPKEESIYIGNLVLCKLINTKTKNEILLLESDNFVEE